MCRDIKVENLLAFEVYDKEHIEGLKRSCQNRQEVHGSNAIGMKAQEPFPFLELVILGLLFRHVPRYGSFRNIESRFLEFCVNTRCSPGRYSL